MFSVSPRIHSMAFAATVVAPMRHFCGAKPREGTRSFSPAYAASVSQSGFLTLLLPILAHLYDPAKKQFVFFRLSKSLFAGVSVFFAGIILLSGISRFWVMQFRKGFPGNIYTRRF